MYYPTGEALVPTVWALRLDLSGSDDTMPTEHMPAGSYGLVPNLFAAYDTRGLFFVVCLGEEFRDTIFETLGFQFLDACQTIRSVQSGCQLDNVLDKDKVPLFLVIDGGLFKVAHVNEPNVQESLDEVEIVPLYQEHH